MKTPDRTLQPHPPFERSSEQRYTIAARDNQLATLRRDDTRAWQPVRLVELSAQRMLLEVDEPLPIDIGVLIRLDLNDNRQWMEYIGTVESSQISARAGWWVSCLLSEPVNEQLIDRLAHKGLVERRHDARYPVQCEVQAKFELTDSWCSGQVVDYSAGGFQLLLPAIPAAAGQRLLVRIENADGEPIDLASRVVWVNSSADEVMLGCKFANRGSYQKFRAATGLSKSPGTAKASSGRKNNVMVTFVQLLLKLAGAGNRSTG